MKKIITIICGMLLTVISSMNAKTLVVYYSYTNNCHDIVQTLSSQIDTDVMRIEPADKTQKYEANGYAIGTKLLNAIKAAPNDAASYPAIDPGASPTSPPITPSSSSLPCGGARWQPSCRPTSFIMVRRWLAKTSD